MRLVLQRSGAGVVEGGFSVWHFWPAPEQPNAKIKYMPFMSNLFWPTLAQGGFSVFARCPHEVTLRINCFLYNLVDKRN